MAKRMWEDDVSEMDLLEDNIPPESEDDADMDAILEEYAEEAPVARKHAPVKSSKNPAYTLNSKETDIMQLAMVQLEQAKLYDMFLKHNLFDGVKANPTALKRVERELKEFILERMQILLGMKEDRKTAQAPQSFKVELPFNEVEIDFIKALAFKGTKGESANAPTKSVEAMSSIKSQADGNLSRMKPLSENKMKAMVSREESSYEEEQEEDVYEEPIRRQPQPVQRQARKVVQSKPTTVEELAREDLKKMAKRKSAYEMSDTELMEANKKIKNNKSAKPSGGLPMPGPDAMMGHYMGQQAQREAISGGGSNMNALLMSKLGLTGSVHNDGDNE